MNNLNENKSNLQSIVSWFAISLITVGAFFCNYYYVLSGPIKAIIWFSWFILTLLLAYLTSQGKQAFQFAMEAKVELLKVVWPARQETIQTTLVVMSMVAVTGFVLWGIDSIMMWTIAKITHLG